MNWHDSVAVTRLAGTLAPCRCHPARAAGALRRVLENLSIGPRLREPQPISRDPGRRTNQGAAGGHYPRRRGQPGKIAVSIQRQPRAPHAAERSPGLCPISDHRPAAPVEQTAAEPRRRDLLGRTAAVDACRRDVGSEPVRFGANRAPHGRSRRPPTDRRMRFGGQASDGRPWRRVRGPLPTFATEHPRGFPAGHAIDPRPAVERGKIQYAWGVAPGSKPTNRETAC